MAETSTTSNTVLIEDAGACRKKLTITVPAERVAEQLESSIDAVATEADLPGFRKGRAPKNLVRKRFGKLVATEAKNQLVAAAYSEALEEHKLRVVGEPEGADELADLELDAASDITFSVEVEIAPDFDLPDFEGIEIKKPVIDVTDDMINEQLNKLLMAEGELEPQQEAGPGDYCIGNGRMNDAEGNELMNLEGAVIRVPAPEDNGKGAILGVVVDDFSTQIGTPKPGDALTVNAQGPQNHENPDVRGKAVTITFDVERCERIKPAPVEDIIARSGLADETQLRENITLRLNQRAVVEQQQAMRSQVARHLLDTIDMELPEKLTAGQAERNVQRRRMDLMYRGMQPDEVENRIADFRASSKDNAARELKLFFIMAKAAEQLGVEVSEDEVSGRIAQIAHSRQMRPQELYQQLAENRQVGLIAQQVREHKAMDAVLAKATIAEVTLEEFNKQQDDHDKVMDD